MGRNESVFFARNNVDQSKFTSAVVTLERALHDDSLVPWKNDYNFVGLHYINIGNDPECDE